VKHKNDMLLVINVREFDFKTVLHHEIIIKSIVS